LKLVVMRGVGVVRREMARKTEIITPVSKSNPIIPFFKVILDLSIC